MIPQRATLFGWSVLLPALYLLWRFCYEEQTRLWLPLALLVLPLPLLHTHSALALVLLCLVSGFYTLVHRPRTWSVLLPWGGLALLCGLAWLAQMLPTVLAQSVDGQNMLRLHFNWVNGQGDGSFKDNYFWFYIKNIGIVYLLLIPSWIHASQKQRWLYGGGLLIWALAEIIVFQPNTYDNNKLLYVWHMLGCLLVAQFLVDAARRISRMPWRVLALGAVCFLAMFGSVLTVIRETLSDYQHWSADEIALADYVSENAASDALFLTCDRHTTPVACPGGAESCVVRAVTSITMVWITATRPLPCGCCMNSRTKAFWTPGASTMSCLTLRFRPNSPLMKVGTWHVILYGTKMTVAAFIR